VTEPQVRSRTPLHGCVLWLSLCLLGAGGPLLLVWLVGGPSRWTLFVALGVLLVSAACVAFVFARRHARSLLVLGLGFLCVPWLYRAVFVRGTDRVQLTTLPADTGPRWVARLYPETDGSLVAARLVQALGGLRDPEAQQFHDIMRDAYARAEPDAASLPTPAIATYLGLQQPSAFDTLVVAPPGVSEPSGALVFLHGYSGNFYVYCWEVAQAAAAARLLTLCPSLGPDGAWWTPRGADTLGATLDYARARGVKRIYLGGLSNGAAGASVLALRFQKELSGLLLLSGSRASQPPDLPVLVVQGKDDQMMPASYAREYAANGHDVRYEEVDGGHLVLFSRYQRVRPLVAQFLKELEGIR